VGELLGYARVATTDQSADGQLDSLRAIGPEWIWTDVVSGVRTPVYVDNENKLSTREGSVIKGAMHRSRRRRQ
jgi:hypothetical protein